MFMDAFTRCGMVSSRFTRQVAQFIKTRMDETAYEWQSLAKAKGLTLAKVGNFWPQALLHRRPLRRVIAKNITVNTNIPVR